MQLDPDVVLKVDSGLLPKTDQSSQQPSNKIGEMNDKKNTRTRDDASSKPSNESKPKTHISIEKTKSAPTDEQSEDTGDEMDSLYKQFQLMTMVDRKFCEKNFPQSSTHISELPMEVIMLIFKWVVSDHLDMRSLENLSRVKITLDHFPFNQCKPFDI